MWYKIQPFVKGAILSLLAAYLVGLLCWIAGGAAGAIEGKIAVGVLIGAGCVWLWFWMTSNPSSTFDEYAARVAAVATIVAVLGVETLVAGLAGGRTWLAWTLIPSISIVATILGCLVWDEAAKPTTEEPAVSPEQDVYSPEDVEVLDRQGP